MTRYSTLPGAGAPVPLFAGDGLEELRALGAHLIPLTGKRPARNGWPDAEPAPLEKARRWLQEGFNVGMVTGENSGLVVVDVDPRNCGDSSLRDLEAELGPLPDTLVCETGGGGEHRYFRWYPGARSGKPAKGIDFQADRRCVVLPPSVHPKTGALYAWREPPNSGCIAELPAVWRDAMAGHTANEGTAQTVGVTALGEASIPEGSRDDSLFKLACKLYVEGASESRVIGRLSEVNDCCCIPPMKPSDVRRIAQSAYRYKPTAQSLLTQWYQCLMRSDLGRRERMVASALMTFSDKDGRQCFPSQESIAERACYVRPRVAEALDKLEAAGWLKRYRIPRSGHGWSHGYRLCLPDVTSENNGRE